MFFSSTNLAMSDLSRFSLASSYFLSIKVLILKNMIEKIGTNAGLVWHALEAGKLELKAIKKATKLTEKEIYAALGWLARESKVAIAEEGKEVFVELI